MDSSDRPEFVEVLAGLAAIWRVDLTKEVIEIWWRSMIDWSIDEFKGAAQYLLKTCEYMPKPYDFEQLRKEAETSAHEAWSLALNHAGGAWRNGLLGDAKIDRVVATLGGYREIALTKTDKLGFLERRFKDTYEDFSYTDDARQALPSLMERPQLQDGARRITTEAETD